jgi:hypothetical protein
MSHRFGHAMSKSTKDTRQYCYKCKRTKTIDEFYDADLNRRDEDYSKLSYQTKMMCISCHARFNIAAPISDSIEVFDEKEGNAFEEEEILDEKVEMDSKASESEEEEILTSSSSEDTDSSEESDESEEEEPRKKIIKRVIDSDDDEPPPKKKQKTLTKTVAKPSSSSSINLYQNEVVNTTKKEINKAIKVEVQKDTYQIGENVIRHIKEEIINQRMEELRKQIRKELVTCTLDNALIAKIVKEEMEKSLS